MDNRDERRGPPLHETAMPETDMRSHYFGAYSVYDYDKPLDPGEVLELPAGKDRCT